MATILLLIWLAILNGSTCPVLEGLDRMSVLAFVSTFQGKFQAQEEKTHAIQQAFMATKLESFQQAFMANQAPQIATAYQNSNEYEKFKTDFTQDYMTSHSIQNPADLDADFTTSLTAAINAEITAKVTVALQAAVVDAITAEVMAAGQAQLAIELPEYVRSKIIDCMVIKSCGANVVQRVPGCVKSATDPTCNDITMQVPSFEGTNCTKCTDIATFESCDFNQMTCHWNDKDKKCGTTNCPHLFSDQYKRFKDSGLTQEGYFEKVHAKENEPHTKEACANHGCVYAPSMYWCSAWARWALILTLVACFLFIIIVGVVVVACCVNRNKTWSEGSAELETKK